MKKTLSIMKKTLSIIFVFILLFSCESSNNFLFQKIDTKNPLENKFTLFKSSLDNVVNGEEFIKKIKIDNDLDEAETIKNITLRELTVQEKAENQKNNTMYVLQGKTDKGVSISHILTFNPDNNALMSEGLTCKCTSTNCDYGCESSIFGGNCRCSSCSSECKKESTSTEVSAP